MICDLCESSLEYCIKCVSNKGFIWTHHLNKDKNFELKIDTVILGRQSDA